MKTNLLTLLLCFALLAPAAATAAEQQQLGVSGEWTSFTFEENGGSVCYMTASPDSAVTEPKGRNRGEIAVFITHRPAEGTKNVFTYMGGYSYQKNSEVSVSIDGKRFKLFTQNDMAWAVDAAADNALAEAVKRGSKMVVEGVSEKGTKTKDTYSLKGSTKAHEMISAACKV